MLRPLQRLEILEHLAVHPLKEGQELFPEALQRLLDGEPVELRAIPLAQRDRERLFGEQLVLDHQR